MSLTTVNCMVWVRIATNSSTAWTLHRARNQVVFQFLHFLLHNTSNFVIQLVLQLCHLTIYLRDGGGHEVVQISNPFKMRGLINKRHPENSVIWEVNQEHTFSIDTKQERLTLATQQQEFLRPYFLSSVTYQWAIWNKRWKTVWEPDQTSLEIFLKLGPCLFCCSSIHTPSLGTVLMACSNGRGDRMEAVQAEKYTHAARAQLSMHLWKFVGALRETMPTHFWTSLNHKSHRFGGTLPEPCRTLENMSCASIVGFFTRMSQPPFLAYVWTWAEPSPLSSNSRTFRNHIRLWRLRKSFKNWDLVWKLGSKCHTPKRATCLHSQSESSFQHIRHVYVDLYVYQNIPYCVHVIYTIY